MFFDNAYSFTGEKLIFLPLPLCLSVDVITPKILNFCSTSFFKHSTEKTGVPMKTIDFLPISFKIFI